MQIFTPDLLKYRLDKISIFKKLFNFLFLFFVFTFLFQNTCKAENSWIRTSSGLGNNVILSICKQSNTLYVGTESQGVFKSDNDAQSWQATPNHSFFALSPAWSMASLDTFVFVGLKGQGILRISPNSNEWKVVNNGLSNKYIQDLKVFGGKLYATSKGAGIFISSNYGENWLPFVANQGIDDKNINCIAQDDQHFYCGSEGSNSSIDSGVAFIISKSGKSWNLINNGFIRNGSILEGIYAIEAKNDLIYAGTDNVGLFKSSNYGESWERIHNYTGDIFSIKSIGNRVYYSTANAGIFLSTDAGKTFNSNNLDLSFSSSTLPNLVKELFIDENVIYAATDIGLFKQTIPNLILKNQKIAVCNGESFKFPDGNIGNYSTIHHSNFKSYQGLDSIVITDLTVHPKFQLSIQKNICSNQIHRFPDGSYSDSSLFNVSRLKSINGCDSVITTTVVVGKSYNLYEFVSTCDKENYKFPDGKEGKFNQVHTSFLKSSLGCDSVITTKLTVSESYNLKDTVFACYGEVYKFPDGKTSINDQVHTSHLLTYTECDSNITTYLKFLPEYKYVKNVEVCKGNPYKLIDGRNVDYAGDFSFKFPKDNGCDSTFITRISEYKLDTSLKIQNSRLEANLADAKYQWLDLSNGINELVGETNKIFIPKYNSKFAVAIEKYQCKDTSRTVDFSTNSIANDLNGLTFYPQPVENYMNISQESDLLIQNIQIFNSYGMQVEELSNINNLHIRLNFETYPSGNYFLRLSRQNEIIYYKFIIQK